MALEKTFMKSEYNKDYFFQPISISVKKSKQISLQKQYFPKKGMKFKLFCLNATNPAIVRSCHIQSTWDGHKFICASQEILSYHEK